MKKILLIALTMFSLGATAQNVDLRRKIEVSGIAEAEVTPDIIYFGITLKEYMDGRNHIKINDLESQLAKAITNAGIAKENFTIDDVSGYKDYYQKKHNPNFFASKQYRIKLSKLNAVNSILENIDQKAIESTDILSSEYSKEPELKRELKLKALVAAKDKATYLLNGVDEKLGRVLQINEVDNGSDAYFQRLLTSNSVQYYNNASSSDQNISFKTIKLRFEIKAVFEIAP